MIHLLIATRNTHKVAEIRAVLGEDFQCRGLDEFRAAPVPTEDAPTFAGNATKKAVELARWLGTTRPSPLAPGHSPQYVLADDSGLEVDALGGAPGVFSARFAASDGTAAASSSNSSDAENNAKLLRLLKDIPPGQRTARFRCVLALTPVMTEAAAGASPVCYGDELEWQTELFEGVCEGAIGFAPLGRGGFGYDPLFVPSGHRQTFAELGEDIKNRLSHRARALARLREKLETHRP